MSWEKMNTPYGVYSKGMINSIGQSSDDTERLEKKHDNEQLWRNIRIAAQTNIPLQDLLKRAIVFYYLSEDIPNGNS